MKREQYIRIKTQDPQFLWRMAIGILVGGLVLGFLAQFLPRANSAERVAIAVGLNADDSRQLKRLIDDDRVSVEEILSAISYYDSAEVDTEQVLIVLASTTRPENERAVIQQLSSSIAAGQPTTELQKLADEFPAVRYANHALAEFFVHKDDYANAAHYFEIEGQRADANIAREKAVRMYGYANDYAALARLAQLTEYQEFITPYERLRIAEARRDWAAIFWTIPQLMSERLKLGATTVLALIAGLGWFIVALQFGQANTAKGVRWWLCALAVPLGCLSIWPTHFLNSWQEITFGLEDSSDLVGGVKYYLLSVGLREEFSKLLLLMPLMPWIVRRGSALEALVVSASVGLGFAILENMGYFYREGGTGTMGRFLTANFLHMILTGLTGLAVARAFWSPRDDAVQALVVFVIAVLAHAFYDAFIGIPALANLSQGLGSSIVFILLAFAFFQELRQHRTTQRETVSLTATFLFVVTSLMSITFIYQCTQLGFRASGQFLFAEIASLGALMFVYLREMPNSLMR